ncbi:MAG TPA: pentapeptide repeat-containing protein [Acidimicrobiales bacterium]|nr:pentapeptide repeat-containing protein [Acidimicrobiales bacterium]
MNVIKRGQDRFRALPAGLKVVIWVVAIALSLVGLFGVGADLLGSGIVALLVPLPILFWIGTSWSQKVKLGASVALGVVAVAQVLGLRAGVDFVLPIALVVLALVGLAFAVVMSPRYRWTGFRDKTLWDWMQLLGVPLVLAGIALLFNLREQERDEQRAATDRSIAVDAQREQTLQKYLDTMTELMLDRGLPSSKPGDEVRTVARTRTLALLRQLDGERKGIVVQFLHLSHLVQGDHAVLDVAGADISDARLTGADLTGANLTGAILRGARLREALLRGADLTGADLEGADLSGAQLQGAILRRANLSAGLLDTDPDSAHWDLQLVFANLSDANLTGADLDGADLGGGQLNGAILATANLRGANLSRDDRCEVLGHPPAITDIERRCDPATLFDADLTDANLTDANLRGADLSADLRGAELRGADLRGADLSFADHIRNGNVRGARVNAETVWPEGFDPESAGVETVE